MYLEAAGFRPHYWCSYSMHHARNIRRLHAIILWNKGTQGIRYSNISNFHPKHRIWCQKSRRYSIVICTLQNWSVKTKTHENIRTRWTTSSAWPFSSSHPHLHRILIFICSTNDWLAYFSKCLKRGGMLHTEQKLSKNWQFFNNENKLSRKKMRRHFSSPMNPMTDDDTFCSNFPYCVTTLLHISWKHLRNFETSCGHRP